MTDLQKISGHHLLYKDSQNTKTNIGTCFKTINKPIFFIDSYWNYSTSVNNTPEEADALDSKRLTSYVYATQQYGCLVGMSIFLRDEFGDYM